MTGAGSGIGQRIAIGLAQCGADVALLDRRTDDGLATTARYVKAAGRRSIEIAADVTQSAALNDAVSRTEAELGPLTLAVNAAGIANANPAEEMEESQFQTMMDINLKGVFLSCQAEARAMLKNGRGSIVNIASMSGVIVNRGLNQCHYNASKAGVIHMSKSMAMEWVGRGIRVNTISPGYTATPMNTRAEMVHQTKLFENRHRCSGWQPLTRWSGRPCSSCLAPQASSPASTCWSMAASAAGNGKSQTRPPKPARCS